MAIHVKHPRIEYVAVRASALVAGATFVGVLASCHGPCAGQRGWVLPGPCRIGTVHALRLWLALCMAPVGLCVCFFLAVRARSRTWDADWEKHCDELDAQQLDRKRHVMSLEQREVGNVIRPMRVYPPVFFLLFGAILVISISTSSGDFLRRHVVVQLGAFVVIGVKGIVFLVQTFMHEELRPSRAPRVLLTRIQNISKPRARVLSVCDVRLIDEQADVSETPEDDRARRRPTGQFHYRLMHEDDEDGNSGVCGDDDDDDGGGS